MTRQRTALVTGGSGFIGTWVLRELIHRSIRPVVFDLRPSPTRWAAVLGADIAHFSFAEGSLLDIERLCNVIDTFDISYIIHLAALLTPACQQDPLEGCRTNVLGSVTMFELARMRASQIQGFSYASSYAVYGPEPDDDPSMLATANHPPTFYGVYKKAVDLIAEQYWQHFGLATLGIRPHVVYGPERDQGLTAGPSLAARAAALGDSYNIGYTGTVGYDYVEDVARAFVQSSLETPLGANIVDLVGDRVSPEQFVEVIEQIVPGASARLSVSGPAIAPNLPPSLNAFSRLFPDWHGTSLLDGVRRTVDFYRSRIETPL